MKTKMMLIPALVFVILMGFVSASTSCPPNVPVGYYGKIIYHGNLLQGDYTLRAVLNHEIVGTNDFSNGNYQIDVSPCYGISSGQISFVINGIEANEKINYNSNNWGKNFNLNLTLNQLPPLGDVCGNGAIEVGEECDDGNTNNLDGCSNICEVEYGYSCVSQPSVCTRIVIVNPFCGDSICNNGETCSSCSVDCGTCPSTPNTGGGGPSHSGSSGNTPNTGINLNNNINANNSQNSGEVIPLETGETTHDSNTQSGITGAVIGFIKTQIGIIVTFFVLLIVILAILLLIIKKTKK